MPAVYGIAGGGGFGDLQGVEGGAFDQVVGYNPHSEAVEMGSVAADGAT